MYRLLARWRERERERLNGKKDCEEGVKLLNMREDTGIDQKEKKIIREYCKQLYAHTFNNLEKLCCFLWKAQATKTHHVE